MSCDYFVFCRTCKERHSFNDANHQDKLMHALVRHASAIAALVPLMNEDPTWGGIELRTSYGRLDPTWFAHHQEHELCVIDEYGKIDGACGRVFNCQWCSCRHYCVLATGHPGACSNKL